MSIVVTGATGQLGRLVVEALLQRGVPAEQAIATGRRTAVLGDLAERGVVVRRADLNDEASLPGAFAGADKLLLGGCWPTLASPMRCCATAGSSRTTPASCRPTPSAASSARPAPAR